MAVPATVIYFTCYDQLCAALRIRMGDCAEEAPLLAGAIARGELTAEWSCLKIERYCDPDWLYLQLGCWWLLQKLRSSMLPISFKDAQLFQIKWFTNLENGFKSQLRLFTLGAIVTWPLFSLCPLCVSGFSISDQPSGVDPHKATVSETVVQGADRLHPLSSAEWRLAVSVERSGAHIAPWRALLYHVLVQLREGKEMAVWMERHQRTHTDHHLYIWSSVWLCTFSFWSWN